MGFKQRFLIFIFLFLLFGSAGLYLAYTVKQKADQKAEKEVEGVQDFSSAPAVTNVPPIEAVVGQEYRYDLTVVDQDTFSGDLLLTITDGPSWLFKTGLAMYGTPSDSDLGTHNVSFTLSDGENTVSESFYIVVENADEGSN
jgi:hypothetical protein